MAAKQVAQSAGKTVFKPLLSTSHALARRRVLNLYRAWWREVLTYRLIWSYGWIYSIKALNVMRKIGDHFGVHMSFQYTVIRGQHSLECFPNEWTTVVMEKSVQFSLV